MESVGGGHGPIGVGEQRVPEVVLGVELALPGDRVTADPDPGRASRRELGGQVTEVAALRGAASAHRQRVEEQHHRTGRERRVNRTEAPYWSGSSKSGA